MEAFIGLRSQGGVPVRQGSGLKKKCVDILFLQAVLLIVLLDLFRVSKMTNFNYDMFKVSKMCLPRHA